MSSSDNTTGSTTSRAHLPGGNVEAAENKKISSSVTDFPSINNCTLTGPHSAVGNVSGYRCESDCRSRGRELDAGPVPYFRGD